MRFGAAYGKKGTYAASGCRQRYLLARARPYGIFELNQQINNSGSLSASVANGGHTAASKPTDTGMIADSSCRAAKAQLTCIISFVGWYHAPRRDHTPLKPTGGTMTPNDCGTSVDRICCTHASVPPQPVCWHNPRATGRNHR
jgi:hypothetical protein